MVNNIINEKIMPNRLDRGFYFGVNRGKFKMFIYQNSMILLS